MKRVAGHEHFQCDYCAGYFFPRENQDGVIVLEKTPAATCPACATAMLVGSIDGRHVLHCPTCRGILTSNANFGHIVRSRRAAFQGCGVIPQPIHEDEFNRILLCPGCNKKMHVHPYYGPGAVVIDTCCSCMLIFLDHGEIAQIQRAPGGPIRN